MAAAALAIAARERSTWRGQGADARENTGIGTACINISDQDPDLAPGADLAWDPNHVPGPVPCLCPCLCSFPDSVAALRAHAAGNGNAAVGTRIAAPLVEGSGPLSTGAGKKAAGQAAAPSGDPTCPSRACAVPNRGPSCWPSVAAHPDASRGNSAADGGSSARGLAG